MLTRMFHKIAYDQSTFCPDTLFGHNIDNMGKRTTTRLFHKYYLQLEILRHLTAFYQTQ